MLGSGHESLNGIAGVAAYCASAVATSRTESDEPQFSPPSSPGILDLPFCFVDTHKKHSVVDGSGTVAKDSVDVQTQFEASTATERGLKTTAAATASQFAETVA